MTHSTKEKQMPLPIDSKVFDLIKRLNAKKVRPGYKEIQKELEGEDKNVHHIFEALYRLMRAGRIERKFCRDRRYKYRLYYKLLT